MLCSRRPSSRFRVCFRAKTTIQIQESNGISRTRWWRAFWRDRTSLTSWSWRSIEIQQKFNSFGAVSEEHNIVVLHHVVLSILLHFAFCSYLLFGLVLNPIFNFAHVDTNELTFKLRVNFASGLRRGGPLLYKPGWNLGWASRIELLKVEDIWTVL